jgi:hypothetical protein
MKGETNKIIMKDRVLPVHKNYSYSGFQQYNTLKNTVYLSGYNRVGDVINIRRIVNLWKGER